MKGYLSLFFICELSIVSLAVAFAPRSGAAGEGKSAVKSIVVPAPRPRHPAYAATMNRQARVSLEELGYTSISERQARATIRRARAGNVARCLDKTLIALGKATGADLVICPRILSGPRGQVVRVSFARVSKRRVWNCRRSLKSGPNRSAQQATEEAVAFCMDQLLSPNPKGIKKEKKKAKTPQRKRSCGRETTTSG